MPQNSPNRSWTTSITFVAPSFVRIGSLISGGKNSQRVDKSWSCVKRCRPMANATTDELEKVIHERLDVGKVTAMTRAGTSGWAVMHRATTDTGKRLFIKVSREDASMFQGEAQGLSAMFDTQTIRVPEVFQYGQLSSVQGSYIIMEALDLSPIYDQGELGRQLARLHLADPVLPEAHQGRFGFSIDNTIGATPQPNGWMEDWVSFFRERRLKHQLLLTGDSGLIDRGNRLCLRLNDLFDDIKDDIKPSLLHGDLWSGNISGEYAAPVIFDPACYYGHHEADFGMSWCGGFASGFWEGYHDLIPRAPRFEQRQKLYQLYHFLNHYNLFGGGYYGMADLILDQLLKELQ
ncbi:unnamed protein product [Chondrus crispus]|uniref:protein-ribulosamine 3-kinase n=1 Tax=Chondrus crispus TaxID=2769 RepID=R7QNU6_CHOCR|nr:unnamed protein product [Chondrus crispus]CDF39151.1 unnamed protein product [Chondrus crispus]|eukprot:XP_005719062.1 unnamed protein product [Chondrus crispus]